jgi:F420-0:gamma-glutamyl ligase
MRTPEQSLWLAVLLLAVSDAIRDDHAVMAAASREAGMRARRYGERKTRTRAVARQILDAADRTRRGARSWLLANRDVAFVADAAGIDAEHLRRLVKRLAANDWRPIGIELGEGLDKLAVRDREVARGVR